MQSYEVAAGHGANKSKDVESAIGIEPTESKEQFGTGVSENVNDLHRTLGHRQVQLMAIGASIGAGIFILIGSSLQAAGPAGMLLAYTVYACILATVNSTVAEMVVFMPVSGSFIRYAAKWVDPALGFTAGWNFFLFQASFIPFEISFVNVLLRYWTHAIPVAAVCGICLVAYFLLNVFAVKFYGESEFWLSGGKVILIFMVFWLTLVTMCGGNPQHDAYGFRYWNNPGSFAESHHTGALGRFEGFLAAMWTAVFTFAGPEYIGMAAGEARNPRKTIKQAYKTIYWRFAFFFIGSALCVGIILPSNDKAFALGLSGGAGSPYVIAMGNMGIKGLPHVFVALLLTSVFSAGNAYTYCAIRSLHSLAVEGHAPKILAKCTKNGVPIYSVIVTMFFPAISFLNVSNSASQVITWLVNLTTAGLILNYIIMAITYLFFFKALKVQGYDRKELPYRGWGQPYVAWVALVSEFCILCCYSYAMYYSFDVGTFFSYYTMCFVGLLTFGGWKIYWKTQFVKPAEADLVWDRPMIDAYEAALPHSTGFWGEMLELVSFNKVRVGNKAA